jgi:hypothetical protein
MNDFQCHELIIIGLNTGTEVETGIPRQTKWEQQRSINQNAFQPK